MKINLVLLLIFLTSFGCKKTDSNPVEAINSGKWTKITGLSGFNYTVSDFAFNGNDLYVATRSGVYLLPNGDTNWVLMNSGMEHFQINALINKGGVLFAGTGDDAFYGGGVFISTNNGNTWSRRDSGLIYTPPGYSPQIPRVDCFVISGSSIFAGTANSGLYHSTNNGISWSVVNDGIMTASKTIFCMALSGSILYVGAGDGLYTSTNAGINWNKNDNNFDYGILSIAVNGNNLFVSNSDVNNGGFYHSTDNGLNWITMKNYGASNNIVESLLIDGSNIYAGSTEGVYISKDNGKNWSIISDETTVLSSVNTIALNNHKFYAATRGYGIWWRPL